MNTVMKNKIITTLLLMRVMIIWIIIMKDMIMYMKTVVMMKTKQYSANVKCWFSSFASYSEYSR